MKSFLECKALSYLTELTQLIESADPGDEEYSQLRLEKETIETALVNDLIKLNEVISNRNMTYHITGKQVNMFSSPRVTKVFFKDVSPVQAVGYGLKKTGTDDLWCLNIWSSNVKVTDLKMHLAGLNIPFKMHSFNMYGGKRT